MSATGSRVLVVMIDSFGRRELERFGDLLGFLPHRRTLHGILGYTSGALPTILTGCSPAEHGRMCLFSRLEPGRDGILEPLSWLGLLPRVLHERSRLRHWLGRLFARQAGLTGYVALHKVPPAEFKWLDLPERDDMFTADSVGGRRTFLADARAAGLRVHATRWQLPDPERWADSLPKLREDPPDLAFLYASALDGVLHAEGSTGSRAAGTFATIAGHLESAREAMSAGGAELTTLVVGDHGMADIDAFVDPRPLLARLPSGLRVFIDSTMLRAWGEAAELDLVRLECERAGFPGTWLGAEALVEREVPMKGRPFGEAFFLLREGALFAPSFLGGRVAGMHGYDLAAESATAALASDRELPEACRSLADLAPIVRGRLGLG